MVTIVSRRHPLEGKEKLEEEGISERLDWGRLRGKNRQGM